MAFPDSASLKCSTVAIIGAGSAGLVAAKYLKAEDCFSSLVVYEQRPSPGGLWQHYPHHHEDAYFHVPQVQAEMGLERPCSGSAESSDLAFVTPVYDSLETNIPRHMMELSDLHFNASLPLFPKHNEVLKYLQAYASDVTDQIRFSQQVTEVRRRHNPDLRKTNAGWSVTSRDVSSDTSVTTDFDAVVVANGHYSVPYIPDIAGLAEWSQQRPGSITHSKYFRNAKDFAQMTVVVIGNSASGIDIAAQLSAVANSPVYVSSKSASEFSSGSAAKSQTVSVSEIKKVNVVEQSITTVDGTAIRGIDAILFCTGYFYSFPFLQESLPGLITDGFMVNGTFQHIFLASDPTLAFLALPQKVIPFPVAEAQAAVVARVFAGRLSLPSELDMQQWEKSLLDKCGSRDKFHTMGFPVDAKYMDTLIAWAERSEPAYKQETSVGGKTARRWTARERWIRQKIPMIKNAYADKGQARHDVRSIEALGFHYRQDD